MRPGWEGGGRGGKCGEKGEGPWIKSLEKQSLHAHAHNPKAPHPVLPFISAPPSYSTHSTRPPCACAADPEAWREGEPVSVRQDLIPGRRPQLRQEQAARCECEKEGGRGGEEGGKKGDAGGDW
jgi:hypothetical protein